jgi:hypothetical protein
MDTVFVAAGRQRGTPAAAARRPRKGSETAPDDTE